MAAGRLEVAALGCADIWRLLNPVETHKHKHFRPGSSVPISFHLLASSFCSAAGLCGEGGGGEREDKAMMLIECLPVPDLRGFMSQT